MSDSSLKELLEKLTKINELSKMAIDDINEFIDKKERNDPIEFKLTSIIPLSEQTTAAKTLYDQVSKSNIKYSKISSLATNSDEIPKKPTQNGVLDPDPANENIIDDTPVVLNVILSTEQMPAECTVEAPVSELTEEIGNKTIVKTTDEIPSECTEKTSIEPTKHIPVESLGETQEDVKPEIIPKLKLVEFSKLVDPKNMELMNKNVQSKTQCKSSIIILSSSDEEVVMKEERRKPSPLSKRVKSSTSSKKDEINKLNPVIKSMDKDTLSVSSSPDVKFCKRAYVKLLRVPCEEMKRFYSHKEKESIAKKNSECAISDVNSDECSESDSQKKKKTNREAAEHDSDDTDNSSRRKAKKKNSTSENHLEINESDSSDDEPLAKTKQCNEQENKEKSSSDSEVFTLKNKNVSEHVDGNAGLQKEPEVGKTDSMDLRQESSDEEGIQKEKNESDKEIVLSSGDSVDDSDVDTFFKKNKFQSRKKMLNMSSESEREKNEDNESKESEKDKDSSASDNDPGKEDMNTKKRRRIKTIESSDSDDGTTRKKLKRLITKDALSASTKKAAADEKERKQRILEKQTKYNQIYESSDLASSRVDKLVLDVDEETGKPLLEVDKALVSKLKPHQASGIQFMWDACFESLARTAKSAGSGCILAHCMGLGKTLQVIALTATLLEEEKTKVKKVLIVTPLSTVLNWKAEYKNWLSGEESFEVYELASIRSQNADRASVIKEWHEAGGVMIISYSMFRNLSNDKNRKVSKKFRTIFCEGLVNPGPDLVVCDEGHLLKNEKTSLSVAMTKIRTRRRIVLTGTPLQNNLKEYYCMVQFVKPNLLGTYKEYLNRFVNPITNGQYTDSTQYDINLMRRRSHVLHKLLDGIVQRRDYSVLSPYLPPKFEYVLFLTLTNVQRKLYKYYMDHFAKEQGESTKTSYLFKDFQALSRICIHPRVLLDKSNDDQQKYQSEEESEGSLKDFINDDDQTTSSSSESSSNSESDSSTAEKKKKRLSKRVTRAQKNNPNVQSESEEEIEEKKEWWQEYCDGEELNNIAHSTKLMLLFEILKECEQIGDKVLLFSQSLYALNLIEYFLEKVDEATQNGDADKKTCGYTGSWSPGLDYFRLDGSTNCGLRSEWCDTFNKETNTRARLFLLSTRAGGLGINLVAANRVILFDVSWNPSSDVQSIYRVYRFGQLKPSYIYRFVTFGTMEMKIYERQVIKQAISKRVIDEQQIDRHYNQDDLAELYKFEEPDMDVRPIPLVPKDVLLGEMLQNHEDKIYKYHEHQSLLENKEDETLNEAERKAAWDEFENEKVERTQKQVFIGKFSVNTVQLALRNIIQKDNPSWNNNQILSIIPQLIQQLNLQLSIGDQTMYNRIAAEVKLMQDEYARKMQMQFYQYRLQLAAQNQLPFQNMQNMLQRQFQMNMMSNRFQTPAGSSTSQNTGNPFMNPNDVVELN